jgi:cytosine/adenosine deaminase-related metal-dependent hydrolase
VLPIADPPIRDGWVAVDRGRIVAVGRRQPNDGAPDADLGRAAILPGLVNAHTHLELSYLHERVPPCSSFVSWIRGIVGARRAQTDPRAPEVMDAIAQAIDASAAAGTALVGDISNTMVTRAPLDASALAGVVFYELIRFRAEGAAEFVDRACRELDAMEPSTHVRTSLAAHAPYSVAPLVFRAIRKAADRRPFVPWSVHLAESAEEVEFLETGGGPWRDFLQDVGAWDPSFVAPGVGPVQYLDDAGLLGERLLVVHGVQMGKSDLSRLAAHRTTLVTCPRSNFHTGAGAPPIGDFYRSDVRVVVGTDSLASTPDLNVFAELATMRALAPDVPADRLLASATIDGARALGFDAEYGSIEPGKTARLIAVSLPSDADVGDVEECLVGGVTPDQIRWLE